MKVRFYYAILLSRFIYEKELIKNWYIIISLSNDFTDMTSKAHTTKGKHKNKSQLTFYNDFLNVMIFYIV